MAAATKLTHQRIRIASSRMVTAAGVDTLSEDAIKMINEEGHLRSEVGDDLSKGFDEWERGFWAARCQMAAAGIKKRRKR